jgi:hypothetical protein
MLNASEGGADKVADMRPDGAAMEKQDVNRSQLVATFFEYTAGIGERKVKYGESVKRPGKRNCGVIGFQW